MSDRRLTERGAGGGGVRIVEFLNALASLIGAIAAMSLVWGILTNQVALIIGKPPLVAINTKEDEG
jgi:hypothetical protein